MGLREHLEEQIAEDLQLLKKLDDRLRTEIDPRLKLRWTEDINEVKLRIRQREEELRSLSVQPEPITPVTPKPQKRRILLLSANPRGTSQLRLDEEMREIKEGLRRSRHREQYEIDTAGAVRYRDIHRAILDYEPNIVHFSGHGISSQGQGLVPDTNRKFSPVPEDAAEQEGLVFEDETGHAKLVDAKALAGLFELFADQVECVVLNACYSKVQAKEIAQHINYVIGMSQAIGDRAAIEFAVGFYDALGAGRPVEFAHRLGCSAIQMAGISENLTPQLLTKNYTPPPESEQEVKPPTQPSPVENITLQPQPRQTGFLSSALGLVLIFSVATTIIAVAIPEVRCFVGLQSECPSSQTSSDPKLISSVTEVDYTPLRDLLAAGKWKEADKETSRAMLQAAGKEKEGWLRTEDLDNFSCEDLGLIDQLWLESSQGKFGFSVQKDIYQNLGGTQVIVEKEINFAPQVGWRQGDEWVNYSDLTFNLNAPRGQLPTRRLDQESDFPWDGMEGLGTFFLANRAETCNL